MSLQEFASACVIIVQLLIPLEDGTAEVIGEGLGTSAHITMN